jgi:hypothetical protein
VKSVSITSSIVERASELVVDADRVNPRDIRMTGWTISRCGGRLGG